MKKQSKHHIHSLTVRITAIAIIPLCILACILTIIGIGSIRSGIQDEVESTLQASTMGVQGMLDGTCPVRRSSTRSNSAGVIVRGARFVPGQNEQRRLQRFVISMYAFFSIRARPPFIFLSIAQRRALANTVFFCYNGGTRAKESFP